jgi:hypothetical protein
MPLAHFVAEAKKNTPVLGKTQSIEGKTTISEADAKPAFERKDLKRTMAVISEGEKAAADAEAKRPGWQTCQYMKVVGEKEMCTQYMSLCSKEKCKKEFMEKDFFEYKRYLKQGKSIK